MSGGKRVVFHGSGRRPQSPADPTYPHGLVMDLSGARERRCAVDLPWPAPEVGTWRVECTLCGTAVALTAASRVDDPRRLMLACDVRPTSTDVARRPWTEAEDGETRE